MIKTSNNVLDDLMFLNFRIPQATFYEMDSKYSRLQNFTNESKSDSINGKNDNERLSSPRNLFQTNINRLQNFFSRYSNSTNDGSLSSSDDLQALLQKGDNDPILPSLTRKQRILGFMICLCMGLLCMGLATLYIPVIVIKARKFAIFFTFGSLFFLSSFSMLWGPMNHFKHLTNIDRLPFLITYIVTLIGTIYYSTWIQSYLFTTIFVFLQIGALVWYVVSYIPGGARGLKFFSKLFYTFVSKTVSTTLSV